MTVGTPCVEGEHCAKDSESHKCHGKQEVLPTVGYGVVGRDLKQIERVSRAVGIRSGMIVYADNAQHQECRSAHKHQGELHG